MPICNGFPTDCVRCINAPWKLKLLRNCYGQKVFVMVLQRKKFVRNKGLFCKTYFFQQICNGLKLQRVFQQLKLCKKKLATVWQRHVFATELKKKTKTKKHLAIYSNFGPIIMQYTIIQDQTFLTHKSNQH